MIMNYKVKMTDTANTDVIVYIATPWTLGEIKVTNPDASWKMDNPGSNLLKFTAGTCAAQQGINSTASSADNSDPNSQSDPSADSVPPPISDDPPLSLGFFSGWDLILCTPSPPYKQLIILTNFFSAVASNSSGAGQLFAGGTNPGGMLAGALTWVQL